MTPTSVSPPPSSVSPVQFQTPPTQSSTTAPAAPRDVPPHLQTLVDTGVLTLEQAQKVVAASTDDASPSPVARPGRSGGGPDHDQDHSIDHNAEHGLDHGGDTKSNESAAAHGTKIPRGGALARRLV